MKTLTGIALFLFIAFLTPGYGLTKKPRYDLKANTGPDMETDGWFINLGITGARGKILPEAPKEMVVAYVFRESPAYEILQEGDRIIAANGKKFTTPHRFGYGMDIFGYEGPMMDIGEALEESQGSPLNGNLTFTIVRGEEEMDVTLRLPTKYGQFSETYPDSCTKSRIILDELLDYLSDHQTDQGGWNAGRPHIDTFAALAMLSSDEAKHQLAARKVAKFFASRLDGKIYYDGGYDCWKYGFYGIYLSEYYLKTGEKWVLEPLQVANEWLVKSQFAEDYRNDKGQGGWGHRPSGKPGGNGYGPICAITGQALAAWALMDRCGLEVNRERYQLAHEFIAQGTNRMGYVWYADGNGGDDKYADMGRTGIGAVAHGLDRMMGSAYEKFAVKLANCIGDNPDTFIDTHGSPIWGTGWTAVGAAFDQEAFRKLMDYNKWHWNLSHCHDGTFYYQPNRDSNPQDYGSNSRISATAMTAMVLSIGNRNLNIFWGEDTSRSSSPLPAEAQAERLSTGESRTFHSADRSKSFEGHLQSFDTATGMVTVIRTNGTGITFPIEKLSTEDQEHVRASSGKASPPASPASAMKIPTNAVHVFILAGQSNMEGHGMIEAKADRNGGQGSLEHLATENVANGKYASLRDGDDWKERDDVFIQYLDRGGKLSAGYGARPDRIGPELGFGWVVGDKFDEPVLLIKTAWGGKSLAVDFLPPSAAEEGEPGPYYKEMIDRVKAVLAEPESVSSDLKGKTLVLRGFGWHQGWNDRINDGFNSAYEQNMIHFINDVRRDLEAPGLPFVIAETGMSGPDEKHPRALSLMEAQEKATRHKDFEGTAAFVETQNFWRPAERSPSKQGYHWNSNAETYYLIGEAMGEAMLGLLD